MVQVSTDISTTSVSAPISSQGAPPANSADSFGGHLQRASDSASSAPQPGGASQSTSQSPANSGASDSSKAASQQSGSQHNSSQAGGSTSQNPPASSNGQTQATQSAAATSTAAAAGSQPANGADKDAAGGKDAEGSHSDTHVDDGTGLLPAIIVLPVPLPTLPQTPLPTSLTPGSSATSSTGTQAQAGNTTATSGGSAIAQALALAAQATAAAATGTSTGAVKGTTADTAPSAAQPTSVAMLAAAMLGSRYGQTSTAGNVPSGPGKSATAPGQGGEQAAQSPTMAAAVVAMLQSAPIAATTQTLPLAAAMTTPPVASATSSLPAISGPQADGKQAGQDKVASAAASNPSAITQPSAAEALSAAARQNAPSASHASAAAQGTTPTVSDGDRMRLVQRVARAFQSVGASDGSVKLRLSPPELGSLRIEIKVDNGQLSARLDAETPAARDTLMENLPALRDKLQQQDIKVVRFDVGLMGQSPGGSPQTPHRDFGNGAGTRRNSSTAGAATDSDLGAAPVTGTTATGGAGLNVVI